MYITTKPLICTLCSEKDQIKKKNLKKLVAFLVFSVFYKFCYVLGVIYCDLRVIAFQTASKTWSASFLAAMQTFMIVINKAARRLG